MGKSASSGVDRIAALDDITLTKREIDVLTLVAAENNNITIASALGVSVRTVETHVASMLRKVGARDRLGLIVRCYAAGVLLPGTLPPQWSGKSRLDLPGTLGGTPEDGKDPATSWRKRGQAGYGSPCMRQSAIRSSFPSASCRPHS